MKLEKRMKLKIVFGLVLAAIPVATAARPSQAAEQMPTPAEATSRAVRQPVVVSRPGLDLFTSRLLSEAAGRTGARAPTATIQTEYADLIRALTIEYAPELSSMGIRVEDWVCFRFDPALERRSPTSEAREAVRNRDVRNWRAGSTGYSPFCVPF